MPSTPPISLPAGSRVAPWCRLSIYRRRLQQRRVFNQHSNKAADDACQHLLNTWKTLGIPDLAQRQVGVSLFDNESAFSGGRYARKISQVVRLCLYFGIPVLFTPLGEANYNWPAETFNALWVKQFWNRHHFSRRRDVPHVQRSFLNWYRTDYVAPPQSDTPARVRRGHRLQRLPARRAEQLPKPLPICAGHIHAVRRVDETGYVRFLNDPPASANAMLGAMSG